LKRFRVLIGEVDPIDLVWIENLLTPEFEVIGAERDGRALIAAATEKQPDVVVLSISMRSLSGIEAARDLRIAVPNVRIVFFTVHSESLFKLEARRAGASAYVSKRTPSKLIGAIHAALDQDAGDDMAIVDEGIRSEAGPNGLLTARQSDVLQLLARGYALKEIATALDISAKTVEFHKYRIMAQLQVRSTAELIATAIRHDLISDPETSGEGYPPYSGTRKTPYRRS
jgi:DNA-binding NarL/FixJ family response regulator